jgi:hypothetical protein
MTSSSVSWVSFGRIGVSLFHGNLYAAVNGVGAVVGFGRELRGLSSRWTSARCPGNQHLLLVPARWGLGDPV